MTTMDWDKELLKAANHGNTGALNKAIQNGANIEARDESNNTALIIATVTGYENLMASLLSVGADTEAIGEHGGTSLSYAVDHGYKYIADELILAGANTDYLTKRERTEYARPILRALRSRLQKTPYKALSNHIVEQHGGVLFSGKTLSTIFNFQAQTAVTLIDDTPISTDRFSDLASRREEVMGAYDWIKEQGKNIQHPFKIQPRRLDKR